jgi:hypothetical protein
MLCWQKKNKQFMFCLWQACSAVGVVIRTVRVGDEPKDGPDVQDLEEQKFCTNSKMDA